MNLLANDQGTTGEGNEDLAHDNIANVDIRLAEVDHQPSAKHGDGNTEVDGDPLEPASVTDGQTDNNGEQARSDAVDLSDVAGLGDGESVDDLEERVEVGVPDVEADEQSGSKNTGAHNGAVREEVIGDEGDGGELGLPDGEDDEEDDAKDEEADDDRGLPLQGLESVHVKSEQEEGQTGGDQKQTNGIELGGVVDKGTGRRSCRCGGRGEDPASWRCGSSGRRGRREAG